MSTDNTDFRKAFFRYIFRRDDIKYKMTEVSQNDDEEFIIVFNYSQIKISCTFKEMPFLSNPTIKNIYDAKPTDMQIWNTESEFFVVNDVFFYLSDIVCYIINLL